MSISRVNRRWRSVALADAQLWTCVQIRFSAPYSWSSDPDAEEHWKDLFLRATSAFSLHRARAKNMPLDITLLLDLSASLLPPSARATFDRIFKESSNWASFRYISFGPEIPSQVLDFLTVSPNPYLSRLSIYSRNEPTNRPLVICTPSPCLQYFDTNIANIAVLRGSSIQNLTLFGAVHAAPGSVLETLRELPQLHTLRLAVVKERHERSETRNDVVPVSLDTVRHIVWGRENEADWLTRMHVPNLDVFELHKIDNLAYTSPTVRRPRFNWDCNDNGWAQEEIPLACPILGGMLSASQLGSPSTLIIRDWDRANDVKALISAFGTHITNLSLGSTKSYDSRICTVSPSTRVFPSLRHIFVPDIVDRQALLPLLSWWDGRDNPDPVVRGAWRLDWGQHSAETEMAALLMVQTKDRLGHGW